MDKARYLRNDKKAGIDQIPTDKIQAMVEPSIIP